MSPTALQILRAALERIGATFGDEADEDVTGDARSCVDCGHYIDTCGTYADQNPGNACPGHIARAALEAADKVPGLADDPRLARAVATEISKARNGHLQQWRNTDLAAAALDAVDAYQRGGAKP